jgi:hypothetical protein
MSATDISYYIPDSVEKRQYALGGTVGVGGIRNYMVGGDVGGTKQGAAVPVIAHVGEWILNKAQQLKLAQRIKLPVNELRMWLFGTEGKKPGGTEEAKPVGARGKTKPKANPYVGPNFKLHPHEDEAGQTVWFVELDTGRWGQVSDRAAKRIMESKGQWMPGYVKRANRAAFGTRALQSFANGGVVSYGIPGSQSFAQGETIVRPTNPITNNTSNKTVRQEFAIHTASPKVDIDYIMRVGAMHAEAAY